MVRRHQRFGHLWTDQTDRQTSIGVRQQVTIAHNDSRFVAQFELSVACAKARRSVKLSRIVGVEKDVVQSGRRLTDVFRRTGGVHHSRRHSGSVTYVNEH